jgi:photosystem II stability/assembly factor-like uncharacterized protein
MKRLVLAATGLVLVLVAAACARPPAEPAAPPSPLLSSPPIDAALVTDGFGWIVTDTDLYTTFDSGQSFQRVDIDTLTGAIQAAYFRDPAHGWVATTDDEGIVVARTTDGGESWRPLRIRAADPITAVSVGFGDAAHGALLAKVQTGAAAPLADLFATADGGASWQSSTAPAAGRVAVGPDGRIWLAGGVRGDELFASGDQGHTWTRPNLRLASPGPIENVAPVGNELIVVTADAGGRSRATALRSADAGASWQESRTVAQLPTGTFRVGFASVGKGWVVASHGTCRSGKRDCSITYQLLSTADSGRTWQQLLSYQEPVG